MVPDIDKVKKGLEHCLHYNGSCIECPYESPDCQNDVLEDAIALIDSQRRYIEFLNAMQTDLMTRWKEIEIGALLFNHYNLM